MPAISTDPRFLAGCALKNQGRYEEAVKFFGELLQVNVVADVTGGVAGATAAVGSEDPALAELYFEYGSTLACASDAASYEAATPPPAAAAAADAAAAAAAADDGASSEDEQESDLDLAWKLLDTARSLFEDRMNAAGEADEALQRTERRNLSKTVTRLGDVDAQSGQWADACAEYCQAIELREVLARPGTGAAGAAAAAAAAPDAESEAERHRDRRNLIDNHACVSKVLAAHAQTFEAEDLEAGDEVLFADAERVPQASAYHTKATDMLDAMCVELSKPGAHQLDDGAKRSLCSLYVDLNEIAGTLGDIAAEAADEAAPAAAAAGGGGQRLGGGGGDGDGGDGGDAPPAKRAKTEE